MKLASIVYPRQLRNLSSFTGYGFDFFLGQWCVKSVQYRLHMMAQRQRGSFIIVDNGAAEPEDERVSFDMILMHVLPYADEIIMPDVLRNAEATMNMLIEALSKYAVPPTKRMFVPQGSSWEEWERCLNEMMCYPFATIGIAKHLEELPGGRAHALTHILERGFNHSKHVHLLGLSTADPLNEVFQLSSKFPWVRSMDTGAPMAWAQEGRWIGDGGPRCSLQPYKNFDVVQYHDNLATIRSYAC